MKFYSLASGSSGNCFLVDNGKETILIDVGIPYKKIKEKLLSLDYNINNIDYILITHEHIDHIRALTSFATSKTFSGVKVMGVSNKLEKNIENTLGTYKVVPFPLSHDVSCCGYRIISDNESLVYLTDSGYVNTKIVPFIANATYYIFESNHDINMLMESDRPYYLKARILSDNGHLNNEDASEAILNVIGPSTKEIYLAHISRECNTKELAYKTLIDTFEKSNYDYKDLLIAPLDKDEILKGGHIYEKDITNA